MSEQFPKYLKHSLKDFLADYPLHTPFLAVENYIQQSQAYTNPFDIRGSTFSFYCNNEEEIRTFELLLTKPSEEYFGRMPGDRIPSELFAPDGRLDFQHHFIGECKSCMDFHVGYLLHVYTDKPIPADQSNYVKFDPVLKLNRPADEFKIDRANLFIEKIGGPKSKIILNKAIEKYLDRESSTWLYKSKVALVEGLGIGAMAYFRRIIEKELIRIVDDISELSSADPELKALVEKYKKSKKPHLIYGAIFAYLPKSLQVLDDNPLKLLYQQTSEGLHNLSDAECLLRATHVEKLLEFVILKINEEKSTMMDYEAL